MKVWLRKVLRDLTPSVPECGLIVMALSSTHILGSRMEEGRREGVNDVHHLSLRGVFHKLPPHLPL